MNAGVPIRVALLGAAGRMGRETVGALRDTPDFRLVAAVGRSGDANIGHDIGELVGGRAVGVALSAGADVAAQAADVVIDYSGPDGFAAGLDACRRARRAFVSGTTGLGAEHFAALETAGREIPVLHASNMTLGMTVLNHLAAEAARLLGEEFDIEILEMHHRYKKDAPSGSALKLGESVAAARGKTLSQCAEFARHGEQVRTPGSIGFASLRGGDVTGDHTVIFAGAGERLELGFRVGSRRVFAHGALRAARWVVAQPAGVYSLADCLGLGDRRG